jgi:hypothetical protein
MEVPLAISNSGGFRDPGELALLRQPFKLRFELPLARHHLLSQLFCCRIERCSELFNAQRIQIDFFPSGLLFARSLPARQRHSQEAAILFHNHNLAAA